MHKFDTRFVFHFYILGSTSWIRTTPWTKAPKFERALQNETQLKASISNIRCSGTSVRRSWKGTANKNSHTYYSGIKECRKRKRKEKSDCQLLQFEVMRMYRYELYQQISPASSMPADPGWFLEQKLVKIPSVSNINQLYVDIVWFFPLLKWRNVL